jgi:hypothetical protein
MEVLASMFVICIGLLGVLAVIPYGAYQTAKARNAENTSWILDAAVKELDVMELAKPENWKITLIGGSVALQTNLAIDNDNDPTTLPTGGTQIYYNNTTTSEQWLDCSRYFMVDPFDNAGTSDPSSHIYKVGVHFDNHSLFRDRMTGQDDLVYTIHSDKRTDFSGQNNKILSSGQYTWFFMFRPEVKSSYTPVDPNWLTRVPWSEIEETADVDILGCYNRVPGSDKEQAVLIIDPPPILYYGSSISVNIPSGDYDLKNTTKYVFLSWSDIPNNRANGGWYKVINVIESTSSTYSVFLTFHGTTPPTIGTDNLQMLIIPGVMYHKRVPNVTIIVR